MKKFDLSKIDWLAVAKAIATMLGVVALFAAFATYPHIIFPMFGFALFVAMLYLFFCILYQAFKRH